LRLMPTSLPNVTGLTLAAECTPAGEVGGDFFDFFPSGGGRVALVVAEGGNDGLAAALTIALAKGFLLCEAGRDSSPGHVLSRLSSLLGRMLTREAAQTSLAFAEIDPEKRTVRIARIGHFPRILSVRSSGAVEVLRGIAAAGELGVEQLDLALGGGDAVVFVTDGVERQLHKRGGGTVEEILRRGAQWKSTDTAHDIHDVLRNAVLPNGRAAEHDLNDDLTTVVVRFDSARASQTVGSVA